MSALIAVATGAVLPVIYGLSAITLNTCLYFATKYEVESASPSERIEVIERLRRESPIREDASGFDRAFFRPLMEPGRNLALRRMERKHSPYGNVM